jgi:TolA-binding protein
MQIYRKLIADMPNSEMSRKAALEIGMIYMNDERLEDAIVAFKKVITAYPGTPEAYTALESMENAYVELNNVTAYLAYAKTINMTLPGNNVSREDSISYVAAEKQYMSASYKQAISGFRLYLNNYCQGGRYCTVARYYLADSYYKIQDYDNALSEFNLLTKLQGNQYMQEAYMRCAEITFDKRDYAASLTYFQQFENVATTTDKKNMARLGILRCSYHLNDHSKTIQIASEIIADSRSAADVVAEARYNRAKSLIATSDMNGAIADLKITSTDTRTSNGAEAKYLLAKVYFDQGNLTQSEQEIVDFAKRNTPYQYWLARGFVLLSDIYINQNNDFQAKQYLLSLQKNYTAEDDIQLMIQERLNGISTRERARIIR